MDNERYLRGWATLKEVAGQAGKNVIESLRDIAPDFAWLLIEFSIGDIYSRPGLDLKTRELTMVALAAQGNAAPHLKVQMAIYAGLFAVKEVFAYQDEPHGHSAQEQVA
jgi:4-carboxymuconolactone decarboxylase